MQQFFQTEHTTEGLFEKLSERLSRLVTAAVNYHSLIQPGRTLHYKVYMGEAWQYPRLTDISTFKMASAQMVRLCSVNSTLSPR